METRPLPSFRGFRVSVVNSYLQSRAGERPRLMREQAYCVGLEGLLELRSPQPTDQRDLAAAPRDRAGADPHIEAIRGWRDLVGPKAWGWVAGAVQDGEDSSNLRTTHR